MEAVLDKNYWDYVPHLSDKYQYAWGNVSLVFGALWDC